ncbi:unnamed protein product [Lepeophtheirus salmonis]|uniref:(salmon louse) hypothetical protein n=1 Tax=Lepeophtheirus salmonis TaxID=72036 RepID=A0A7R8CRR5_LEPSM|nr:unnamed protein product [Lepeophtheirus salmonis]CAF2870533.1 unnamed protein product [Lepeophtheirus salmonis]
MTLESYWEVDEEMESRQMDEREEEEEEDLSGEEELEGKARVEFVQFNWRLSAAEYVLHKRMMPDYFRSYVHALASYRGVIEESLESLRSRLISLSECPPKNVSANSLMPPNISGMIRNMASKSPHFDLESLLSARSDLFLGFQREGPLRGQYSLFDSHTTAAQNPSSPRSFTPLAAKNIKSALFTYFKLYPDVFHVNPETSLLKLRRRYFDPGFRASLRKVVESNENKQGLDLNLRETDVTTTGIVESKVESTSCRVKFLHFPHVPPALLQLRRRSLLPKKGEFTSVGSCPPDVLEDLSGTVRVVLSPRSAIIRFCHQQGEEEAYLNIHQVCFDGLACGLGLPLDIYFHRDDPVIFDACRQVDYRGVRYRVCRISFASNYNSNNERDMFEKMEAILGGKPRLTDDTEKLVLSVLESVTPDVVLPKFITNLSVLDTVFLQLTGSDQKKEEFLIAFEEYVRKLLVKMLLDYNDKRILTTPKA